MGSGGFEPAFDSKMSRGSADCCGRVSAMAEPLRNVKCPTPLMCAGPREGRGGGGTGGTSRSTAHRFREKLGAFGALLAGTK